MTKKTDKSLILVGIDTGTKTGFAYSHNGELQIVNTTSIIKAQKALSYIKFVTIYSGTELVVCIEDVRKRKWVDPRIGRERLQGVGSVKRDCAIWQEFCEHYNIPYLLIEPKNILTKLDAKTFKQQTGWTKRTGQDARDAAMMIHKYYKLFKSGAIEMPITAKDMEV